MSLQTVARRYAGALADVVTSRSEEREVHEELSAWGELLSTNPQLADVFRHPTIPYEQKRDVLNSLVERTKVRPTTANFLQVLLRNHRLADLGEINKAFMQELDRRSGVVSAQVTTARPVSEEAKESLRVRLSELTQSRVRLQFEVDEGLIGGVTTRIGSTVYDGSVRTQLQQMKQKMIGER